MRVGGLYGPDISFLSIEKCDLGDDSTFINKDAVVIGAPYDGGTSYRSGTRFGPQAIRLTDYIPHDTLRPHIVLDSDGLQDLNIVDAGDSEMPPTNIDIALKNLLADVTTIAKSGARPIVLGGDHSISYANITGIADAVGKKKFGVIHFDAHPDTADVELGQKHGHGQWVRRVIEAGIISGENFVQFGIRGYWPDKSVLDWTRQQGATWYTMTDIYTRGVEVCVNEAIKKATKNVDGLFISVDVDVCDPAFMPGTGTPEPGGLAAIEILHIIRKIAMENNIVGFDIVELNPAYDHVEISALLANRIVLELLSGLAYQKKGSVSGEI